MKFRTQIWREGNLRSEENTRRQVMRMEKYQAGRDVCAVRVAYYNEMSLAEPVMPSRDVDELR
jgi:hypothetical protein